MIFHGFRVRQFCEQLSQVRVGFQVVRLRRLDEPVQRALAKAPEGQQQRPGRTLSDSIQPDQVR